MTDFEKEISEIKGLIGSCSSERIAEGERVKAKRMYISLLLIAIFLGIVIWTNFEDNNSNIHKISISLLVTCVLYGVYETYATANWGKYSLAGAAVIFILVCAFIYSDSFYKVKYDELASIITKEKISTLKIFDHVKVKRKLQDVMDASSNYDKIVNLIDVYGINQGKSIQKFQDSTVNELNNYFNSVKNLKTTLTNKSNAQIPISIAQLDEMVKNSVIYCSNNNMEVQVLISDIGSDSKGQKIKDRIFYNVLKNQFITKKAENYYLWDPGNSISFPMDFEYEGEDRALLKKVELSFSQVRNVKLGGKSQVLTVKLVGITQDILLRNAKNSVRQNALGVGVLSKLEESSKGGTP